jgi:hypothetical protein
MLGIDIKTNDILGEDRVKDAEEEEEEESREK